MKNLKKNVSLLIVIFMCLSFSSGCGALADKRLNIVPSETAKMEFETYDNGLFSMTIPNGWVVTTIGDYIHYTIRVTSPTDPAYQIFYNLKTEGYSKSYQVQQFWKTYYPDGGFGDMPVISEYTAECFFTVFSALGPLNNNETFTFPVVNDFNVIENFGATVFGGNLLRATFENENGAMCEGLFTASVYDPGQYMINSNPFDFSSPKIDTYPLNVYNTIFITAPEGDFVNYMDILDDCIGSLKFSDSFIQGFNSQEEAVLSQVMANSRINSEISDMIMSSWENRSNSYDIISQKQSDATLGYERVYDTDTGEVYKAYNGFTDDYSGKTFEPITDDMYTEPIAGYIEK